MNREQNKKLLNRTGLAVLKRPDGGVVTQRTANPLSFSSQWRKTANYHELFSTRPVRMLSGDFAEHSGKLLTRSYP